MNPPPTPLGARSLWQTACLTFLLIAATACQSVNHLRDAQDAFNQASTLDLQAAFEPGILVTESNQANAVLRWTNVRNQYGSALLSLERIQGKDERVLREAKLWGAKLTLEALCHWKLGDYSRALELARTAEQTDLLPRDRVVLIALPALIMIDHAYELRDRGMAQPPRSPERTNLVRQIGDLTVRPGGAVEILQKARSPQALDEHHPVHLFLLQSQLAAYRNYRKGFELIDPTGVPASDPAHQMAQGQLNDLAGRVSGDSGQSLVNRWAELNNLSPRSVSR